MYIILQHIPQVRKSGNRKYMSTYCHVSDTPAHMASDSIRDRGITQINGFKGVRPIGHERISLTMGNLVN